MLGDRLKQRARVSILDKLKQKGMPMSPVPESITPEQMLPEGAEETLNDMQFFPEPMPGKKPAKKKKPLPSEGEEASSPVVTTGAY